MFLFFRLYREVRLGIKNLVLNGLRSLLTMFGMVFGVSSVVAMLAVGEGASREALKQIHLLGSTNIMIHAQQPSEESSQSKGRVRMNVFGLLYEDVRRIDETLPEVRHIVPARFLRKEGRFHARSAELRLVGTSPEWFSLVKRPLVAGRTLLPRDISAKANVVVLTEAAARYLLAGEAPIGAQIRVGADFFEVVGVSATPGETVGGIQLPDEKMDAYLPLSTMQERFGEVVVSRSSGASSRELVELHEIVLQVDDTSEVEGVASAIEAMLTKFHPRRDFRLQVPLALLRQAEATKRTFNLVLGSIAAISLLVGGIGIMNIMLASVTERTREIGIRRAIGAKRSQIVRQFLIETVVLSTVGGILGLAVGFGLPWLISRITGIPTLVTGNSLALALSISMAVGLVFGIYPAVRAARLDPIQALRHE